MEETCTNQLDTEKPLAVQEEKPTAVREEQPTAEQNEQSEAPEMNNDFFVKSSEDLLKLAKEAYAAIQEAEKADQPPEPEIFWEDDADPMDDRLKAKSEDAYIDIANQIVTCATIQLGEQNESKNTLKKIFTIFFVVLLSAQYMALAALLFIRAFQKESLLTDTVIITYITSVFLETLGAVIIMIRYAFASDQETKVLSILNSIIDRFKKFSN